MRARLVPTVLFLLSPSVIKLTDPTLRWPLWSALHVCVHTECRLSLPPSLSGKKSKHTRHARALTWIFIDRKSTVEEAPEVISYLPLGNYKKLCIAHLNMSHAFTYFRKCSCTVLYWNRLTFSYAKVLSNDETQI